MATRISKKPKAVRTFRSAAAMQAWGRQLARRLKPGDCIALIGPLGAGKTTLVQSIVEAWGYPRRATSPTFALVNEYRTRKGNVYHMDMYRLSAKELAAFPLEDYLDSGLCLIEWADRVADRWPAQTLSISLRHAPGDARDLRFPAMNAAWKKRLGPLAASSAS